MNVYLHRMSENTSDAIEILIDAALISLKVIFLSDSLVFSDGLLVDLTGVAEVSLVQIVEAVQSRATACEGKAENERACEQLNISYQIKCQEHCRLSH